MLNRVAVTFLVLNSTGSEALAAASFAISFAPYLGLAESSAPSWTATPTAAS